MFIGFALIAAFVAGGVSMFVISEHYYHRIAAILDLDDGTTRKRRPVSMIKRSEGSRK